MKNNLKQNKLFLCYLELRFKIPHPKSFFLKRRIWILLDPNILSKFCGKLGRSLASCNTMPPDSDTALDVFKTTLLKVCC